MTTGLLSVSDICSNVLGDEKQHNDTASMIPHGTAPSVVPAVPSVSEKACSEIVHREASPSCDSTMQEQLEGVITTASGLSNDHNELICSSSTRCSTCIDSPESAEADHGAASPLELSSSPVHSLEAASPIPVTIQVEGEAAVDETEVWEVDQREVLPEQLPPEIDIAGTHSYQVQAEQIRNEHKAAWEFHNRTVSQLEQQIQRLERHIKEVEHRMEETSDSCIDDLVCCAHEQRKEIQNLEASNEALRRQLFEATQRFESVEMDLRCAQSQNEQVEQELKEEVHSLKDELKKSKEEILMKEQEVAAKEEDIRRLNDVLDKMTAKMTLHEEKERSLLTEHSTLRVTNRELKTDPHPLNDQLNEYSNPSINSNETNQQLGEEVQKAEKLKMTQESAAEDSKSNPLNVEQMETNDDSESMRVHGLAADPRIHGFAADLSKEEESQSVEGHQLEVSFSENDECEPVEAHPLENGFLIEDEGHLVEIHELEDDFSNMNVEEAELRRLIEQLQIENRRLSLKMDELENHFKNEMVTFQEEWATRFDKLSSRVERAATRNNSCLSRRSWF